MRPPLLALVLIACAPPDGVDTDATDTDVAACDPTVRDVALPDVHGDIETRRITLSPQVLDAASDAYPVSKHDVWLPTDPALTVRDELFVMLPGTNNHGTGFSALARMAARAGYATVVLAYESETHHASLCGDLASDPEVMEDCREDVILEKVTGEDRSDRLDLDDADGIEGRLRRVLAAADQAFPDFPVDRWYADGEVAWEHVIVAGFSQGSVMAGVVGQRHELARSVLIAGGCDDLETRTGEAIIAGWCSDARATPLDRTFALMHELDEVNADRAIHEAIGLTAYGDYADVDVERPSYCGTHLLATDQPSRGGGRDYHLSMAHDNAIPVDDEGIPVLADAYLWALGAAE